MSYRMRVHGITNVVHSDVDVVSLTMMPVYVLSYDLEAFAGLGDVQYTTDPARAMTWPDLESFHRAYTSVSMVRPTRDDGRPNRPLTALTVEPERV